MSAPITISPTTGVKINLQVPTKNQQVVSPDNTPPECIATPSRRRRTRRRLRASESLSQSFQDEYEFQEGEQGVIGAGAYAVVRIATHKRTGQQYAVKVIDKNNRNNTKDKCMNEARLLHQVSGFKNIVKLHDFKEDKDNFYMVFEYVQGGNLQAQLDARGGTLEEDEVAAMVRDLANGLHFLHAKRIAHRDLKPANILCERENFVSPCKIADFDLASAENMNNSSTVLSSIFHSPPSPSLANSNFSVPLECRKSTTSNMDSGIDACSPPQGGMTDSPGKPRSWSNEQHKMECVFEDEVLHSKRTIEPPMEMSSPVGSPEYMPPEIATLFLFGNGYEQGEEEQDGFDHFVHEYDRSYTQACDIWSLGVIAYVALCGKPPFAAIAENCSNGDCRWNEGGACEQCQASLFEEIYYADLQFSDPKWSEISCEAKDLISRCLDRDANQRISAYEILEHPFLQRLNKKVPTTTKPLEAPTDSLLSEKFNSCCSLTYTQHQPKFSQISLLSSTTNTHHLMEDSDSGNCDTHMLVDENNYRRIVETTGPMTLKVPGQAIVHPFYPPRERIRLDSWDGRFE